MQGSGRYAFLQRMLITLSPIHPCIFISAKYFPVNIKIMSDLNLQHPTFSTDANDQKTLFSAQTGQKSLDGKIFSSSGQLKQKLQLR